MHYPGYAKAMSLRGGEADAAILWCCDGAHKDDGIAALAMAKQPLHYNNRVQYPGYNKAMSLRGGEADAAILWYCDSGHKDEGIASLRSQ